MDIFDRVAPAPSTAPQQPSPTGDIFDRVAPVASATPGQPSFIDTLGAGLKEAVTHPLNFAGEAAGVFSPPSVEAGLGAVGAAINPPNAQVQEQAATDVMNELPSPIRPVVAGVAQTLLPKAALLSRAIAGQEQGNNLEGLNASLQKGFENTNPGLIGKAANVVTNVGTNLPFLANGAAPVMMAAEGAESAITQNAQNPNQSTAEDLTNIGGQAALNFLFGKLLPGQKLNDAALKKFAPALLKSAEGAIKRTLLQGGVQAAEGYAFQLASNAVRKLAGQDVDLTEGAAGNALVQGLTGAALHGLKEHGAQPAPTPEQPKADTSLLERAVVKSREGDNKGQPLEFASLEDKARKVLQLGWRGEVAEQAQRLVGKSLEQGRAAMDAAPSPELVRKTEESTPPLAGGEPDFTQATFESASNADRGTSARIGRGMSEKVQAKQAESAAQSEANKPIYDLSFERSSTARDIAEQRASSLDKPMYIFAGEDGKYKVDPRNPGRSGTLVVSPQGEYSVAPPRAEQIGKERRGTVDYAVSDDDVKMSVSRVKEGSAKEGRDYTPAPPSTKLQADFGKQFTKATGARIVWYEGHGTGFVERGNPGVIHVNRMKVNTPEKLQMVGAHELMHSLAKLRPGLFSEMETAVSPAVREKHAEKYMELFRKAGMKGTPDLREESITVPFGELSTGQHIMRMLRQQNPTVFDKVVRFFREIAAKMGHGGSKEWLGAVNVWEKILNEPLSDKSTFKPEKLAVDFMPDEAPAKKEESPLSLRVTATEGRAAYKAEDAKRAAVGEPERISDAETESKAAEIVKRGDPAIHELSEKASRGELFNDAETAAVRQIVDQHLPKALQDGNVNRVALLGSLIAADRVAGTEAGRAFRQRRDPVKPAEFLRNTFAEALATPPVGEGKTSTKAERIDYLKSVKQHLKKSGVLKQMTPENMKDPVWVSKQLNEISTLNPKANKLYEYFLASILSGPQTQERNLIGNVVNATMNHGILRPIEMAVNTFVKDPKAAQWGEWKYIFRGMGPRLQAAWTNALQSFRAEKPIFQGRIMEPIKDLGQGPAIAGKKGEIIRAPLRLLTAVDQYMKTVVGMGEAGARAFRLGKEKGLKPNSPQMEAFINKQTGDLDSPAWKEAYDYAKFVAFQDESGPFTKAINKVREVEVYGYKPLRYMILGPFIRIGSKLESEMWNYTPLGTARMAAKGLSGAYEGKRGAMVQDFAKQVVAWSLFGSLWAAMGDGEDEPWITGSETKGSAGSQYHPMSLRLPGYGWVSYKHLQPISGAISTMIDTLQGVKAVKQGQGIDEAVGDFLGKAKNRIKDQTFLQSLGDFLDAMDSPDKATQLLVNFGASWVPNLIRQPSYQADDKVRESKTLEDTSPFERLGRRSLPGVYKALPRVSPWGNEVTKPGTALERMVIPFARYSDDPSNADKVITKYNLTHPTDPYYVDVPSTSVLVNDKFSKMTEREYYLHLRLSGLLADRTVNQIQAVRNGTATPAVIDAIKTARESSVRRSSLFIRTAVEYRQANRTADYKSVLDRMEQAIKGIEERP